MIVVKSKRAVCSNCDCYIDEDEIAIFRDGDLMCESCLKKWAGEDFACFLEWLIGYKCVTYGISFITKYFDEEHIDFMNSE